jgi:hypothetical protein
MDESLTDEMLRLLKRVLSLVLVLVALNLAVSIDSTLVVRS